MLGLIDDGSLDACVSDIERDAFWYVVLCHANNLSMLYVVRGLKVLMEIYLRPTRKIMLLN